jgi:predicted permease
MLEGLLKDIRYSLRALAHSPGFALVAVLTLAVAIAANTTVFSWVNAVLLDPVPGLSDSRPVYSLETVRADGHGFSYPDYLDCRKYLRSLESLAASQEPAAFDLGDSNNPRRVWGELVTGNYLSTLGARPVLGRSFHPEENAEKALVSVISYRLWREYFHSDPNAVGRVVHINRHEVTIIGVAPPGFGGAWRGVAFDMWVPLTMGVQLNQASEGILNERGARGLLTTARLKPGVTLEQAKAEARSLGVLIAKAHPESNTSVGIELHTEEQSQNNAKNLLAGPLSILLAMCGVVLLIACANVANLLLARATARQKELSLRLALGASRKRLTRQLLTDASLIAALGTVIGILLALWARHSLALLVPPVDTPVFLDIPFNARILGFSILVCVGAALISGIMPALHAVRPDMIDVLKEGGRGGSSGSATHRMRDILVIGEVALALVALAGAGLFAKSFRSASSIDPGFDPKGVLISRFFLSPSGYTTFAQRAGFMRGVSERLGVQPGVDGVGYAESIPMGFEGAPGCGVDVAGYVRPQGENPAIDRNLISPGFFHLMRIPVLEGREFGPSDDGQSALVAVVNQAFLRHYLGGRSPVGMQIKGCGKPVTIVGLARDSKYYSFVETTRPVIYIPFLQRYGDVGEYDRGIGLFVRSKGTPGQALPALRRAVASMDPGVGVYNAMPFEDFIGASVFGQRVAASLLSVLGAIALLLAAVGLYSVMAYSVSQRTHEIGIRMALGGQRSRVMSMVLKKGLALTLIGLAAGLIVALSASQVVASMLLSVSATDPWIFAGACAFLAAIAVLASLLPARKATQVDPLVALHHE